MRTVIATILVSTTLIVPSLTFAVLENNALYQWESSNGTPTYSPDPPPKGVKYIIVGADLQPLAEQPEVTAKAQESDKKTLTAKTNAAPPASKWKPVRYANDPGLQSKPVLTTIQSTPAEAAIAPTASSKYESDECLLLKRDRLILEGQFARAGTDTEMDTTVLKLRDKTSEYNNKCAG